MFSNPLPRPWYAWLQEVLITSQIWNHIVSRRSWLYSWHSHQHSPVIILKWKAKLTTPSLDFSPSRTTKTHRTQRMVICTRKLIFHVNRLHNWSWQSFLFTSARGAFNALHTLFQPVVTHYSHYQHYTLQSMTWCGSKLFFTPKYKLRRNRNKTRLAKGRSALTSLVNLSFVQTSEFSAV